MLALSKRGWPALCVSLFASTVSAAIPDADGVIHGCYNVLTGTSRIVDGDSCNLLEKQITWQQKGPQGPQGPQGPAGSSSVATGHGGFNLVAPGEENVGLVYGWTYTAAKAATCFVTVTAELNSYEGAPRLRVAPVTRWGTNGQGVGQAITLQDVPKFAGEFDVYTKHQQGMIMSWFVMTPGVTYQFGARVESEAPYVLETDKPQSQVGVTVMWMCQENDSNPYFPTSTGPHR